MVDEKREDWPAWAQDLTEDQIKAVKREVFRGNSFYAYMSGVRTVSAKRALKLYDILIALDKPVRLHDLRPDYWGPNDTGPER